MIMTIFQQEWFQTILGAISAGVALLITFAFAQLSRWLTSKIKNEKLRNATNIVINLVQDTVLEVQQLYVEQLKKEGKFDKEAQASVFNIVFNKVMMQLNAESKAILQEFYPYLEEWVKTLIESAVHSMLPHTPDKKTLLG
jgi:hypothetical protein